jgi:hypothetical protein
VAHYYSAMDSLLVRSRDGTIMARRSTFHETLVTNLGFTDDDADNFITNLPQLFTSDDTLEAVTVAEFMSTQPYNPVTEHEMERLGLHRGSNALQFREAFITAYDDQIIPDEILNASSEDLIQHVVAAFRPDEVQEGVTWNQFVRCIENNVVAILVIVVLHAVAAALVAAGVIGTVVIVIGGVIIVIASAAFFWVIAASLGVGLATVALLCLTGAWH